MTVFTPFIRSIFMICCVVIACFSVAACEAKPTLKEACTGFDRDHARDVYVSKTVKNGTKMMRIVIVGVGSAAGHQGDPVYTALQERIDNMQRALAYCPPLTKSSGQFRTCEQTDKVSGFPYRAIDYEVNCPTQGAGQTPTRR